MEKIISPIVSVRLFADGEKCFGPGVAELLRRVRTEHSLRAAAFSMGMAYSKAWTIVKNAEAGLGFKLLLSTTGGRHGGGAALSPEAENLLTAYDGYCAALRRFAGAEFDRAFAWLIDE